ncbi:MAG: sulfotransferase family protein [Deltaproteobacteria bacterium]
MPSSPEIAPEPVGADCLTAAANPYLFVVGCPRSGTTLLQRMLDHHPQLAVANDTHFIPRCIEKTVPEAIPLAVRGADLTLTAELIDAVKSYHRFPRLGLSPDSVDQAARASRTYRQFVSALYAAYAKQHDKALAGEKTPDYVRHIPLLHGLFPAARIVHIIRDGRDVALSTLEWATAEKGPGKFDLWRTEPVAVCALWWRWLVGSGREAGRKLSPACYFEVGYEDLLAHVKARLCSLSAFLDLSYSPEMAAYHEGKSRSQPGLSAKKAWLPPTQGLRDWRTQMADRDVALFEALAGDLLADLGYDRAFTTFSPEITSRAESCEHWWHANAAPRHGMAEAQSASGSDLSG